MLCGCFYLSLYTTGVPTNIFNSLPELNSSSLDLINIVLLILGFIFFNNRFEYAAINEPCSNLDSYELFNKDKYNDSNLLLFADKGKGKEVYTNESSDSETENQPAASNDTEATEGSEISPEEAIDIQNAIIASRNPTAVDTEGETELASSSTGKRKRVTDDTGVIEQLEPNSFYSQEGNLLYVDKKGNRLDLDTIYDLRPDATDIAKYAADVGKHPSQVTERELDALKDRYSDFFLVNKETNQLLSQEEHDLFYKKGLNKNLNESGEPESKKLKLDTDSTTVESTATDSATVEPTATSSTTVEPSVTNSTPVESTDTNLIPNSSQVNISSTESNQASTSSTDLPTDSESNSTGGLTSWLSQILEMYSPSPKSSGSNTPTSGSKSNSKDTDGDGDDFDGGDSGGGGD